MSLMIAIDVLKGLIPTAFSVTDANDAYREEAQFSYQPLAANAAATPLPEHVMWVARRKMRVIGARFSPDAAVTGVATNFFSVVLAVRHAAAPATQKIIITYDSNATPAKDVPAFGTRDFYAAGDVNAAAADADFILLPGDVLTLTVTKTGTGAIFPSADVNVVLEDRD
jgi:hypothetical protein